MYLLGADSKPLIKPSCCQQLTLITRYWLRLKRWFTHCGKGLLRVLSISINHYNGVSLILTAQRRDFF
ncbi:MAG: hypothetical protein ACI9WS_000448 [Paraglaciecola psychrophila]|jgi:hypothetical protein